MQKPLSRALFALWFLSMPMVHAEPPITPVIVDQGVMSRELRAALAELDALERSIQRPPELQRKISTRTQAAATAIRAALQQVEQARVLEGPLAEGRPHPERPVAERPVPVPNNPPVVVINPGPAAPGPVVVVTPPTQVTPPAPARPAPPPVAAVQAISSTELMRVVEEIRKESFSDAKLRIVSSVASSSYFTVSQVQSIMGCFTFDKDKLQVVEILAPRILDRENVYKIYGSFDFESSKREAEKYLR